MMNELIDKILQNPLFLQLKNITENNTYHDHEDVYSHVLSTKELAVRAITGNFIADFDSKDKFRRFVNEDFHGMKRSEVMVLIALLHDVGKMLYVREGSTIKPLLVTDSLGNTSCPGHEYWGSTIISEILSGLPISKVVIDYIASVVKLHDTFNDSYFANKVNWPLELVINDVKSRAEGLYKEVLFNVYCDCFAAAPFQKAKEMIIRIFNDQSIYEERQYITRK